MVESGLDSVCLSTSKSKDEQAPGDDNAVRKIYPQIIGLSLQ